jgi:hypothetical protein
MDLPAYNCEVPASAFYGRGVDVGGVKFLDRHLGSNRHTHCSGSTAKINDDAGLGACRHALLQQRNGLRNNKFRSPARHEDTGINGNAKATEPGPANNVFKGLTGNPPANPFGELRGAGRFGQQQFGFFFGEDAACRPEQGNDFGKNGTGK